MSKWCNTCHRNDLKDKWNSCSSDCPVFGKDFDELAEIVIEQQAGIEALRWTNKLLIKTEKEARRNLWKKAITQFAEKLRNEAVTKCNWDDCVDVDDINTIEKELLSGGDTDDRK